MSWRNRVITIVTVAAFFVVAFLVWRSKYAWPTPSAADVPCGEACAGFEAFPNGEGQQESDTWYSLKLLSQPAGTVHVRTSRYEAGGAKRWLVEFEMRLVARRGGARFELLQKTRTLSDDDGRLIRYEQRDQQLGSEGQMTHAGRIGSEWVTVRGIGGTDVKRVLFEPEALDENRDVEILFARRPPVLGEELSYRGYNSIIGDYTNIHLRVLEVRVGPPAQFVLQGRSDAETGMVRRVLINEKYQIVREESTIGNMKIVIERLAGPPEDSAFEEAPDITPLMSIPVDRALPKSENVRRVRYRLEGLQDVDAARLIGPGQSVMKQPGAGAFEIEVRRLDPPASLPFPPPLPAARDERASLQQALLPTSYVQSDDPEIRALASGATRNATDAWSAARALRAVVSDRIKGSMGTVFASAKEALRSGVGDCTEYSVLLAALARAAGIPARCPIGVVYTDRAFVGHMWTEVWVGEWRPLDAALGLDQVGPTRIRLGLQPLQFEEGQAHFEAAFISGLKISIEEVESDP
jgi:transglutaminase-like putative cysteine protease